MDLPLGRWIDIASGVFLLLLGLWVGTLRPRRRATVLFGLAAGCWGIGRVLGNMGEALEVQPLVLAGGAFLFPSAACVLFLVATLGTRSAGAMGLSVLVVALALAAGTWMGGIIERTPAASLHRAALYAAALFLALLVARERASEGASPAPLMAAALLMDPSLRVGVELLAGDPARNGIAWIALHLLVVGGWLWATARLAGEASRRARNVALVIAALPLPGAALALLLADPFTGPFGVARIATVVLLAYAILRHQLLGLDVKVRWTISKTTVAAAFIAVFFIVSEGAQQFFGQTLGSQYVGILAAGALVFAIAPLSRLADRLAEKAVPIAGSAPAPSGKETAYRAALRVALRDRVLTPEEQIGLAHLSDELGLTHKRAREIWIEVEKERAADEAAG